MSQVSRSTSKSKFESGDTPTGADFADLHDSVQWYNDPVPSHTQSADTITDGTTNKAYTATEKTKLSGIASGATANDTDANLKNRANHTGTQTSATISDFTEAVQDAVAAFLGAGSNVVVTYDDAANSLTIASTGGGTGGLDAETVRDVIGAAIIGVGNITVAYNDTLDTITVSTTATQNSTDAALRDRSTHTGTQSADTITDGTTNKAFLATERTKLAGIASGATANSSDATLLNRANHTGTQAATTIVEDSTHRFATDAEKTTWNAKQGALTLTTTGSSGAATLVGNTLNIPQYSGGGGGGTAYGINVTDYGAVGDGSTDNATAFTNAIAALPSAGGVIIVPNGNFKVNSSIAVNKPVLFLGYGGSAFEYGSMTATTRIFTASATIKLFDITADNVQFRDVMIENTATTPTAGAGIYVVGIGFRLINSMVTGFYINVDLESAYSFKIEGNTICGHVLAGIRCRNLLIPDEGDGIITGNWIYTKLRNATYHILQNSGGGLKVSNNKFNNDKLADGGPWQVQYCFYAQFQTSPTVLLIFTGNSFENYTTSAIKVIPNGNFGGMVVVCGNQISSYNNGTLDLDFSSSSFTGLVVTGNFGAGGTGKTFIDYSGALAVTIAGNSFTDYPSANMPPMYLHTDYNGTQKMKIDYNGATLPGVGDVATALAAKQTTLVSGTNIKTVNGSSILGSGDLTVAGGGSGGDMLATLLSSEVSVTGAVTLTSTAFGKMHVCTGTSADYTVGLPAVSGNAGKLIGFRMSNALTKLVTLDPNGSETIDGATTRVLWKNEVAILLCDGTTWTKIAGKSIPMVAVVAPSADGSATGGATRIPVALDTVVSDAAGMADTANNRIFIRRAGNYLVTPVIRWAALPGSVNRLISFASLNGSSSDFLHQGETSGQSGSIPFAFTPSVAPYAAGDYLKLYGYHGSGSSLSIRGSGTTENSFLSIEEKLSW